MPTLSELLEPDVVPAAGGPGSGSGCGYVDLLGDVHQAGPVTGIAQRLMRTTALPYVYERHWRPLLGRVAKGRSGPTMADEHAFARRGLALRAGDVVLDVACGTGAFTRRFGAVVGPSGLAVGLDASRPMLDRAVRSTPAGAAVAYLRADAVRPPLRTGVVDGVCCFAALHMFASPQTALASFARVLRPGGRLVLLTSARRPSTPLGIVDAATGRLTGQRMFGRAELRGLLRSAGFVDVTAVYAGVTQLVVARNRG